jgi:Rrf2 family protein
MLSVTTEHALRALVGLAQMPPEKPLLGRDLAARAGIPANYLAKILLTLRNGGMVETARGQGGGYRLAKRPDQIVLVDVVDLFEGIHGRPGCFLGESHDCSDREACSAHQAWNEVRQVYLKFLTTNTIADIGRARVSASSSKARSKKTSVSLSESV